MEIIASKKPGEVEGRLDVSMVNTAGICFVERPSLIQMEMLLGGAEQMY